MSRVSRTLESNSQVDLRTSALSESIGCEVHGVDLSQPISDEVLRAIRAHLAAHSIVLFRNQQALTPVAQIEFSRRFGALEHHVVSDFLLPDHPEIFVVSNIIENGRHIGAHGGAKNWHSDLSYMSEPSMGSLFYCLECPSEGGETEFASMYAAWDGLEPERQQWLLQQQVVYDYVWHYENWLSHRTPLTEQQKAKIPPVVHPAVRTHPETGRKALYVSHQLVKQFVGMSIEQSQPIIKELVAFATQEPFTYKHRWRPGDAVFWDNRSAMHRACPFNEKGERRLMYRTTVKGDRPYLDAA